MYFGKRGAASGDSIKLESQKRKMRSLAMISNKRLASSAGGLAGKLWALYNIHIIVVVAKAAITLFVFVGFACLELPVIYVMEEK